MSPALALHRATAPGIRAAARAATTTARRRPPTFPATSLTCTPSCSRNTSSSSSSWPYTPSPPQFGTYDQLDPSTAMEMYPDPLPVATSIPRPPYVPANFFTAPIWEHADTTDDRPPESVRLDSRNHDRVRAAGRAAAVVLREIGKLVRPGVTTAEIDEAAHRAIVRRGAYPSPLGYSHFPRSITTSVNNVIAHGIPDDRPLQPTDIVNLDVTLYLNGYHGDTSATFALPDTDQQGLDLIEATRAALEMGIAACGPGKPYRGIGQAIEEYAKKAGFGVNTQFTGHGIGKRFHQEPWILHSQNMSMEKMKPGDCFTIEPPLVQGMKTRGTLWDDGWTASTESGARSAQFEHQVLITEDGVEVLTRPPEPGEDEWQRPPLRVL